MAEAVAPPGWPRSVRPPGVPGWEESAAAWLLDQCPPEYRGIAVAICASGNYLAGTVWPPIIQYGINTVGWRTTYICIGSNSQTSINNRSATSRG